jgi:hypothetical protein
MSCPRRDEILAVGALDDPERAEHVRGCDDCRARLAHLEHTFATLRSAEVGLDGASRARVWRQVEAARSPAWSPGWPWLLGVPAAAAALTLLVLTSLRPPEPSDDELEAPVVVAGVLRASEGGALVAGPLPRDTWLETPDPLVLRVASARLTAQAGARLSLARGLDDRLWWARGQVSVVAGAHALELITPAARVRAADAAYTLEATATRVVIEVSTGVVEVSHGGVRRPVRAGERAVVELPAAATTAGDGEATSHDPRPTRPAREAPVEAAAPMPAHATPDEARPATERPAALDTPGETQRAHASDPIREPSPHRVAASERRGPSSREAVPPAASAAVALADARQYLGRDDRRAAALADAVVARAPESVEALLVAGDARRRQALWLEAEQLYRRAIEHPDGAPFLEEASLRRAEAQAARGEPGAALSSLSAARAARTDFLGPERAALEARLHLEGGHDEHAYAALLGAAGSNDRVLDAPRLQLARRLVQHDRARAAQLLEKLMARGGASASEAREILGADDTSVAPAPSR